MKKMTIELYPYQVTSLVAVVLLLHGITFLAGYFWGKKNALEEFSEQIKNESFSDKVYASLCSLYEQPPESGTSAGTLHTADMIKDDVVEENPEESSPDKPQGTFFAQLIGYGSEKQAQAYLNSLQRRGITASIVTRKSISSQGKKRIWFQVVTAPASYEETQRLVERLAIEDRLAGVSILEEPQATE